MEKDALGKMGTFDRGKMTSRTKQKDTFHGELSAKPHLWKWAVGAFKEPEGTRDDNFTPTLRHRPFSAATNFSYLWLTECARIRLAVCRSGRLLSLSDSGPGATSVPRPGSQHDERRLRLVHVLANENMAQWSTVGLVRPIRQWSGSTAPSASFPRRQTGPRQLPLALRGRRPDFFTCTHWGLRLHWAPLPNEPKIALLWHNSNLNNSNSLVNYHWLITKLEM